MIEREQRIQDALETVGYVDPYAPTDAPPGSLRKIAVLRARAALGLPMHLPGDSGFGREVQLRAAKVLLRLWDDD